MASGGYTLDLGTVPLLDVLESSVDSLRPDAETKGIAVESRFVSDTGSLRADATRLQQVVWNILSNALKYTPPGGRVTVSSERIGDTVEIRIADTGKGIAPDFMPHVFEPFRQASAGTGRTSTGLGLGLAIVRHLVELHGGRVRIESPGIGWGTTVVVALPVAGPAWAGKSPIAAREAEPVEDVRLNGLHVLVVEDDRECRELVSTILDCAGARVTAVSSAREAIMLLESAPTDVLVSDIGMPGEDGFTLITRVRGLDGAVAKIPALALTGYEAAGRDALMPGRFQRIAVKPIEPTQLVATIARLASSRGQFDPL